jgi:ribosomal protein S4
MRFQKKYKIFYQQNNNKSIDIPIRVLKFHRTKWNVLLSKTKQRKRLQFFIYFKQKIKKIFLKNLKRKFFTNTQLLKSVKQNYSSEVKLANATKRISLLNLNLQIPIKRWERIKKMHKLSLQLKTYFYQLYDNNMLYNSMKKKIFSFKGIKYQEQLFQSLMQFEFRLDILLWRLRFFKNSYESSLFIDHSFIRVNSKVVKNNYILKAGDIISFSNYFSFFSNNLKSLKKNFLFKNFLEIDYYTNTIIIVYDIDEIFELDYSLFMKQYFDLLKFQYSLK